MEQLLSFDENLELRGVVYYKRKQKMGKKRTFCPISASLHVTTKNKQMPMEVYAMAINYAVFDSMTNSEDKMIEQFKIPRGQACVYLRAYIIMRLLFFKELVISDSSINLNRALRTLILRDEGGQLYDYRRLPKESDFAKLIKEGSIKLAARDDYRGSFSQSLRNAQSNKKRVDFPSREYTELIDEICKEENIYWWNEKEVSQMFTKNIRRNLEQQYSDEINLFLRDLSNRLSGQEILTYNMVKNEALNMKKKTSEEYRILYDMLRNSYDYNIPEYLKLNYLKGLSSFQQPVKKHSFEISLPEQYDIPWRYSFNLYALALLPADYLIDIVWTSSAYNRYEKAMAQYMKGLISFNQFLVTFQGYLDFIDNLLVYLYKTKYESNNSKNIILRLKEYKNGFDFMALTTEAGVWAYGMMEAVSDIGSDPARSILNVVLANIFPSIILKAYEHYTELPAIDHAIIKLDK